MTLTFATLSVLRPTMCSSEILVLSTRFVELLGGAIWVESEVGKGSIFQFCLPLFLNTPPKEIGSAEASPKVRSPGQFAKAFIILRQHNCGSGHPFFLSSLF